METKHHNKLTVESDVPKAGPIDSPDRRVENGHIWDELLCFPFFNLSSRPFQFPRGFFT